MALSLARTASGRLSFIGVSIQPGASALTQMRKRASVSAALRTSRLAPAFDESGFARPGQVTLISGGAHSSALVSARTAREYELAPNGANESETMQSGELDAGALPAADCLAALDRRIYVANLWYLNFSDRSACRITGMTRFATFWVEGGRIVAPLNVMRFDDSIYRMMGSGLEALTAEREWIHSRDTYGQRSVESMRVPGALLSGLRLTL